VSNFGLLKSFDVDHGELDGMTPQECFVLGYELAQIDFQLKQNSEIRQPVHASNQARITKSCNDANRAFRLNWMRGDVSECWMLLEVDAAA
jgi:hypothetical protein